MTIEKAKLILQEASTVKLIQGDGGYGGDGTQHKIVARIKFTTHRL